MSRRAPSIPRLYTSDAPWVLAQRLWEEEVRARRARGEPDPAPDAFFVEGVQRVAQKWVAELKRHRAHAGKREFWPEVPERIAAGAYLLLAYCHKHAQPAPAPLLTLVFAVLGLNEGRPPPALSEELGAAAGIRDMAAFRKAAELDGRADASGDTLSVNELACRVDVTRDTVRRWRQHPRYQLHRAVMASRLRSQTDPGTRT